MRAVAGAALALVFGLAGCGTSKEPVAPVAETTVAEAPPAFHFQSGDLELGEFDPYTMKEDLFDPCTEITDEEFAAAGLVGERHDVPYDPHIQKMGCFFDTENPYVMLGVISNAVSRPIYEERGEGPRKPAVDVPGAYLVHTGSDDEDCLVAVDTTRGSVGVLAGTLDPNIPVDELCVLATDAFSKLYGL